MENASTLVALLGLGIGAVIGAAAFLSNFCALGGVADILFAKDWRRMRAWTLAAGVAILGTQALDSAGLIHIDRVLAPYLLWLPTLLGGAAFGFGMALSGGCLNRALVRIGTGSGKSLVIVLVAGIAAALITTGPLKPINDALARAGSLDLMVAPAALHRLFAVVPSWDAEIVRWIFTVVLGGGLIVFSLKDSWFRATRDQMIAAIIIGLAIPAAWLVTNGTDQQGAVNFTTSSADLARLMRFYVVPTFGIAVLVGVPVGAFIAAALTRNLALETFTNIKEELPRTVIGAALMGFGGALALGDTFGQGLSGLSTFSVSAMLAIAGMFFGTLWGIRYFEAEGLWRGLRLVFTRGA